MEENINAKMIASKATPYHPCQTCPKGTQRSLRLERRGAMSGRVPLVIDESDILLE